MGKSKADEMHIWTQEQYEQFSGAIQKSSIKLAFDMLFYTGMRSGELLALTPADILPTKRVDINKNYAKVRGIVSRTEDAQSKMVYLYSGLFI